MISQAKTPDDIVNGVQNLYQELGEAQFAALTQAFQQSKTSAVQKNQQGGRLEYLIRKMAELDKRPTRRYTTEGGMGYVTHATSDGADYTLNTDKQDSLM